MQLLPELSELEVVQISAGVGVTPEQASQWVWLDPCSTQQHWNSRKNRIVKLNESSVLMLFAAFLPLFATASAASSLLLSSASAVSMSSSSPLPYGRHSRMSHSYEKTKKRLNSFVDILYGFDTQDGWVCGIIALWWMQVGSSSRSTKSFLTYLIFQSAHAL